MDFVGSSVEHCCHSWIPTICTCGLRVAVISRETLECAGGMRGSLPLRVSARKRLLVVGLRLKSGWSVFRADSKKCPKNALKKTFHRQNNQYDTAISTSAGLCLTSFLKSASKAST